MCRHGLQRCAESVASPSLTYPSNIQRENEALSWPMYSCVAKHQIAFFFLPADELWKVYSATTIDVAMLQEIHANEGSDGVAVVHYAKEWALTGPFLASHDEVR